MGAAKILVVEDEGLTAMEIQRKLRTWGYDVPSFAFSCKEAVKKAKEIKPDLILMDIMLKGQGDGVVAAEEIKNVWDIPIIYLTAYDDADTRQRAKITNPTAYLIKPFEENELHDKIQTALSEHKLEKKLLDTGKNLDNKLKDFGVIVVNFRGIVKYINSLASNLTGFNYEEAVGKKFSEIFPLKQITDDKDVEDQLKVFIKENTGIKSRSVITKDGTDVNIEYNINSIIGDNDQFLGAELIFKDITSDLKDKQSLIDREKKFSSIYYQSMIPTILFDSQGKFKDANPASLELVGAEDLDDLNNLNLFKVFKLDSNQLEILNEGLEVKSESKLNFEGLKNIGFQSALNNLDLHLNLYIHPMKTGGVIKEYLVQLHDNTKYYVAEKSLSNDQKRYLELFDLLDQVILLYNNDLKCVYCNNPLKDIIDLKRDDLIGESFQESLKSFWDDELEAKSLETLETGKPFHITRSYYSGEMSSYVQIKALKYSEGLIIILNDITDVTLREIELKKSENLYSSVVNEQTEVICRFNPDFELTFANETYQSLFGINNKNKSVFSLSEDDMGKMESHFKSFDENKDTKIFEGPIKMPNGKVSWWQWITRAKFDEEGNVSEYQTVGRDLTPYQVAFNEIKEQTEELQATIKIKNTELEQVKTSFESEIEESKGELEDLRQTLEVEIKAREEKIAFLENINKDLEDKLQEESQKLADSLKNHIQEQEILLNRENDLKKRLKLVEIDFKDEKIETERLNKSLEKEVHVRKKTEEELQKTVSTLVEEVNKSENFLKEIKDLEGKIGQKELEITEIKNNFQEEINQLKIGFEAEISNITARELQLMESNEEKDQSLKNVYEGVKKNMRMISTLNRLHSDYLTDQMIQKLQDGRSYLRSFGMVHEKLYQSEDLETVKLDEYLNSILDDISRSHGAKNIDVNVETNGISLDMETAVFSGLIITELVINSLKHAFPDCDQGKITIDVSSLGSDMVIKVSDNGVGIPSNISANDIDSFGLQLIRTLVEQSKGKMDFKVDNGTKFIIEIPNRNHYLS